MKVKSLAPWFGSKRTMAPAIVELIGPHTGYWEPFCGSMAVLLCKPRSRAETVNDLHGDLINLAKVIQHDKLGPEFYRTARRVLFHEDLFCESRQTIVGAPDWDGELSLDRALAYLIFSWFGRNGSAGLPATERSGNICVRWVNSGGEPGKRWQSVVESIPSWRRRLRGVTVLRRDGFDILDKIKDAAGVAVYVDPPYLVKGSKYLHDFTLADHGRLSRAVARFKKARVVVSYYDHPQLVKLYPSSKWTKHDMSRNKNLSNAAGARGTAPEVLLINQAPPSGQKFLF